MRRRLRFAMYIERVVLLCGQTILVSFFFFFCKQICRQRIVAACDYVDFVDNLRHGHLLVSIRIRGLLSLRHIPHTRTLNSQQAAKPMTLEVSDTNARL